VDRDDRYELLDAGDGRRLERFGRYIVDRPAPMAESIRLDPDAWPSADLRFDRYMGWSGPAAEPANPEPWMLGEQGLTFELRPTEAGQLGYFPEQAPNRAWVRATLAPLDRVDILNLFAYTGGITLAAAIAGASVTHVDGSRPAVAWARRNAQLSGLADRPVRWIVDDAEAFVAREMRRERRCDAVVLDPPSYGHGAGGRPWRLEERLTELLAACAGATSRDPAFAVLTAHTPGFGPERLAAELASAFDRRAADIEMGELGLQARSGARLRLGAFARMIRG
jgi:23S rRNA (cytosine1962-C5)-methyltransferase